MTTVADVLRAAGVTLDADELEGRWGVNPGTPVVIEPTASLDPEPDMSDALFNAGVAVFDLRLTPWWQIVERFRCWRQARHWSRVAASMAMERVQR